MEIDKDVRDRFYVRQLRPTQRFPVVLVLFSMFAVLAALPTSSCGNPSSSGGKTVGTQTVYPAPGNFSYTVPAGVSSLQVQLWGGGGGGETWVDSNNACAGVGGGGGGGGYTSTVVSVSPGQIIQVTLSATLARRGLPGALVVRRSGVRLEHWRPPQGAKAAECTGKGGAGGLGSTNNGFSGSDYAGNVGGNGGAAGGPGVVQAGKEWPVQVPELVVASQAEVVGAVDTTAMARAALTLAGPARTGGL